MGTKVRVGPSLHVNNLTQSSPWTVSYAAANVSGNVVHGVNTLEFLVWNTGGALPPAAGQTPGVGGPTGFAGDITVHGDATPVPEPASLVLVGSALAGFCASRRRSR